MKSITNFRDLGGVRTKTGATIRARALLRSGELSHVSSEEQASLVKDYQLGHIIDLRTAVEITDAPDVSIADVAYSHLDIIGPKEEKGASLSEFIQMGSTEQAHSHMEKLYREFVLSQVAQKEYQNFLEIVEKIPTDKSILFHCFAGKDRTGIGAVLLLEILGVSREAIYADYLATNTLRIKENNELMAQARANGLRDDSVAALEVALRVEARYLDVYYETVEAEYGSVAQYLEEVYHVSKERQEHFQARFLVTD